jgi:hypothetical protein
MPVKFSNLPNSSNPMIPSTGGHSLAGLQSTARAALGLPPTVDVAVGVTRTVVRQGGIELTLPLGVKEFMAGETATAPVIKRLHALFGTAPTTVAIDTPLPSAYSDMADQHWVEHVAAKLFPGVISLYQATELYQPVLGSSSGSIYKTCFIGPDLKIAARIKGSKVSFRATTSKNLCPTGQVRTTIERLGVTSSYDDRMTTHATMNGPYTTEHAHEYRALFGAFYAALKPWITSHFPAIGKLAEGVK